MYIGLKSIYFYYATAYCKNESQNSYFIVIISSDAELSCKLNISLSLWATHELSQLING